jgi:hypothetical protein
LQEIVKKLDAQCLVCSLSALLPITSATAAFRPDIFFSYHTMKWAGVASGVVEMKSRATKCPVQEWMMNGASFTSH